MPFADSLKLIANSSLPASALIEVGNDHRPADPEPLQAMLFEPENWVEGNNKLKPIAEDLLDLILAQRNWLKKKYSAE